MEINQNKIKMKRKLLHDWQDEKENKIKPSYP